MIAGKREWYFQKDETCYSGVVKIAEKVKRDIFLVTGNTPLDFENQNDKHSVVLYGTVGNSILLDEYEVITILDIPELFLPKK